MPGPPTRTHVVLRAAWVGLMVFLGVAGGGTALHLAVRGGLDRRRLRRWAAEWAVVEPVWTSRSD